MKNVNRRTFLGILVAIPLALKVTEKKVFSYDKEDFYRHEIDPELSKISAAYLEELVPSYEWEDMVFPVVDNPKFRVWTSTGASNFEPGGYTIQGVWD